MKLRMKLAALATAGASIMVESAAKLAAIGLVCGLAVAPLAGRLIESMLFGVPAARLPRNWRVAAT